VGRVGSVGRGSGSDGAGSLLADRPATRCDNYLAFALVRSLTGFAAVSSGWGKNPVQNAAVGEYVSAGFAMDGAGCPVGLLHTNVVAAPFLGLVFSEFFWRDADQQVGKMSIPSLRKRNLTRTHGHRTRPGARTLA